MTATEFWTDRFGEKPQTDAEQLAIAMMSDYSTYCFEECFKEITEPKRSEKDTGQYMNHKMVR